MASARLLDGVLREPGEARYIIISHSFEVLSTRSNILTPLLSVQVDTRTCAKYFVQEAYLRR